MEQNVVLEMRGINKNFPGVKALQNVDFTLRKGEIHALMGENGAGKSTLIKVLTGVEEFETGTIRIDGLSSTIINRSPQEAQENGISTNNFSTSPSSREEVGSSSINTLADISTARAMAIICWMAME